MLTDENVDTARSPSHWEDGPHPAENPTHADMKTHSAQNACDCHGGRARGCQCEGAKPPAGLHRPLGALTDDSRWTGSSRNVVSVAALIRVHCHPCDGRTLPRMDRGREPVPLFHLHPRKQSASHAGRGNVAGEVVMAAETNRGSGSPGAKTQRPQMLSDGGPSSPTRL